MLKEAIDMIFGALTAAATVFTAWVAWRVFQTQQAQELPAIDVSVWPRPDLQSWQLTVTATNRAEVRWHCTQLTMRRPRLLRVAAFTETTAPNTKLGERKWEAAAIKREAQKSVPMRLSVAHAGAHSSLGIYGNDDRHSETFMLVAEAASRAPIRASMRLTLRSNDPIARARNITVTRVLPTLTTVSTD